MSRRRMPYLPEFIAPTRHTDPAQALAQVRLIYDRSVAHLRDAMQRFVAGETLPGHVRAYYPFVRIQTDTATRLNGSEAHLSYGFVAETEAQVEAHLHSHLDLLPAADHASRAIVVQMEADEARHGQEARELGAIDLPAPVKALMAAAAKVMTTTAYRI